MVRSAGSVRTYVCRICRSNLKPEGGRQFSTTSQRSRTIPEFVPTASPDLNSLLSEWRRKVFTPAVLASHHQALIYKKSRHDILKNDPGVTVTLSNDEDVKLEPMERFDKPNKRSTLSEIARVLGSSSDAELWANLQPFLEGIKTAKYEIPMAWREKITRKANEQGKQGIILQCAQMAKKTDMKLSIKPVTRELLIGCHGRAIEAGFSGDATQTAGKTVNRIVVMLEDEEHCGGKLQPGHVDMRQDPLVFAILLEFASARALEQQNGKDTDGQVGKLVNKIIMYAEVNGGGVLPDTSSNDVKQKDLFEDAVILYNSLEMALKVDLKQSLGKENVMKADLELNRLSTQLKERIGQLVNKFNGLEKGKPERALLMWQKVQDVQKSLS